VAIERSPEEILEIRHKLVELEFRCKSDERFLYQLREEPAKLLREFGLDEYTTDQVMPQLTGEERSSPSCSKCDPYTCWVTGCCYFTVDPPTKVPTA
jgi:hypothetical protein